MRNVVNSHKVGHWPRESGDPRVDGKVLNATRYVCGPLIDAHPYHPYTVLTSLTYCEDFMKKSGMTFFTVTADMQLLK